MTDEQCIAIMAAVMFRPGEGAIEAHVATARLIFEHNKTRGPLSSPTLPHELRKATVSHPTKEQWNEAHQARLQGKITGTPG